MENLTELLLELENCLASYCKPMYDRMLNPLDNKEIDFYFNKIGLESQIIKSLYLWKNGIPNNGDLFTYSYGICSFGVFPPLDYLVTVYNLAIKDGDWNKSLIPVVVSYAGDFLLFESDANKIDHGQLYLYCPTFGYVYETISYYDSVECMIRTIIKCFLSGGFVYDTESMSLKEDQDIVFAISAEMNPQSHYWDDYRK